MAMRTRRSVGNPTAAVMRRTCRLRPSLIVSSIQLVAILRRKRIGGSRGHSAGSGTIRACAGRVRPSLRGTPRRNGSNASFVGVPSTCTQ